MPHHVATAKQAAARQVVNEPCITAITDNHTVIPANKNMTAISVIVWEMGIMQLLILDDF